MKIAPVFNRYNCNRTDASKNATSSNPISSNFNQLRYNSHSLSFGAIESTMSLLDKNYNACQIKENRLTAKSNKIIIDSSEKFVALSNSPELWDKTFVLTKDIDLSNVQNFKPIGNQKKPFSGKFNGNDCNITNLNIENPESNNQGLFGVVKNSHIKNVNLSNASVNGKSQIGSLVGYGINSNIKDCTIKNTLINGRSKIGGLIGLSVNNNIGNSFVNAKINSKIEIAGGIVGYDERSRIESSYSSSQVSSLSKAGGIIGYSNSSDLISSNFIGDVDADEKIGGLIGWSDSANIFDSYSRSNSKDILGYNNSRSIVNSGEIKNKNDLKSSYNRLLWQHDNNSKYLSLPRLHSAVVKEKPEKIFIEDLNFNIQSGIFDTKPLEYKAFSQPEHFPENTGELTLAKESMNPKELKKLFGNVALRLYYDMEDKKYDEVLLEIIKNPHFRPNEKYNAPTNDNFACTPLFIITTLNRPHLLREMLKRNDLGDVEKLNGHFETGKKPVMERAISHNLLDCVYVMLKAKNQNFDIATHKNNAKYASKEIQELFDKYPNIPEYENITRNNKKTVGKINSLQDILTSVDIPTDFEDSQGNSILNIATLIDDEQYALQILITAIKRGFDIEHKNKDGVTPLKTVLSNNKIFLAYKLLQNGANIKTVNNDGENAMSVFSKIADENVANNFIVFAQTKGISINSQDKNGNTPLINAINNENIEVVKNLLQKGASVNLPNTEGQTPLHIACSNENNEIIALLLDNCADVFAKNQADDSPKAYLCEKELIEYYEGFENLYAENNINSSASYAGLNSINENKNYINLNISKGNPLHVFAKDNSEYSKEYLNLLVNKGKNINDQNELGETPLMLAIQAYIDSDSNGEKLNALSNIKFIVENNPDLELLNNNNQSAMHYACQSDNAIILNLLLRKDPKINVRDELGNTPMNYITADNVSKAMKKYIENIGKANE